jgi:hypothetical protein
MKAVVIGAATASIALPAIAFCVAGGRRLHRAVSCRREALEHRLQECALELLAAIVLMAIFMIVTQPETCKATDTRSCRRSDSRLARPCRACASLLKSCRRDLEHLWTRTQGKFEVV